ncbi:MAG: dihydroorotate dehydrogenase B catalytic subunit [Deltaproteobacteria bacterium RIFCSPLOWO2_02_FULL_50_16]|nr:MAG: dihydroorotate dehydrogenase B catalytic subunit [Deltaproteobacteria bacterium RIFCSPLOWO2_02_FULL_50_16]
MKPDLSVDIGRLKLKNPILVASGTFGYGEEFQRLYDIGQLGAVCTKGISLRPRKGNPTPRIVETPSGMLNAIGLQNVGVKEFLSQKLPFLQKSGATVIVNVFGTKMDDYVELAKRLDGVRGIAALELNISCPNVKKGGIEFGGQPEMAVRLVKAVRKAAKTHLMVKLSPSAPSIPEMARALEGAGADSLSLINTLPAMMVDVRKRRPVLANGIGGLSGPAIRPVAVRMVSEAARAVRIPIIGIGGIMSLNDVLEFLLVGATAVQIGTANFVDPYVAPRLIEELSCYLEKEKIPSVSDLTGAME